MKFTKRILATLLTLSLALTLALPFSVYAQSEEVPKPLAFWNSVYIIYHGQINRQLKVTGGIAPYRYEIADNNLGLSVNPDAGLLHSDGTKKSGSVTVTVYDANNDSAICTVRLFDPVTGWFYQNVIVGLGYALMAIGSWLASPFILLYKLVFRK